MGAENAKQTDANGDDAVIDGVGKTVTENKEVKEIETVVTAGNDDGDARNESDGSNDSESEHDEQKTRDIEEDGKMLVKMMEVVQMALSLAFLDFQKHLNHSLDVDQKLIGTCILFLEQKLVTDTECCVSFWCKRF